MLKEFREFALKGNLVDIAVGLILGAAFGAVANSLVEDIIMPPVGALIGGVDFSNIFTVLRDGPTAGPYPSLAAARAAGAAVIAWGNFLNVVITFLLTALAVFMLVKAMNAARRRQTSEADAPATPELTTDQQLLSEIRDALRNRPVG